MTARAAVVLVGLALVAPAWSGCARQDDRATATVKGDEQEVRVDMVGTAYRPLTIGAEADIRLVIHLRNRDVRHHTFTDAGAGIDVDLGPGEEREILVDGLPEGSIRHFLCRFHEGDGMKGKISYVKAL